MRNSRGWKTTASILLGAAIGCAQMPEAPQPGEVAQADLSSGTVQALTAAGRSTHISYALADPPGGLQELTLNFSPIDDLIRTSAYSDGAGDVFATVTADPPGGRGVSCALRGGGASVIGTVDPPEPDRPAAFDVALASADGVGLATVTVDPPEPDHPGRLNFRLTGTTIDVIVTADPPGSITGDPPGGLTWRLAVDTFDKEHRLLGSFADNAVISTGR
jgi:hypothetical protein